MQEGNAVGCLGERVEAQAVSMNFLNKLGHSLRESAFSYILSITVGHTFPQQGCSPRLHWDQKQNYSNDSNFCSSRKRRNAWSTVTAELPFASLRKYDAWQVKLIYATGNNKKWIRKKWRKSHDWRLPYLWGTDPLGSHMAHYGAMGLLHVWYMHVYYRPLEGKEKVHLELLSVQPQHFWKGSNMMAPWALQVRTGEAMAFQSGVWTLPSCDTREA